MLNEYLWYDKLWGPSQRVVTLLKKFGLSSIFLVNDVFQSSVWAVVLNRRDEGSWNISEYSIASQNDDMPEVTETKEVYKKRCLNIYKHRLYHFRPIQIVGLAFLG